MNLVSAILMLIGLYLPAVLNQGTKVTVYVENSCGPIHDAYVELHFRPGGEVIRGGTDENGKFWVMGPKADFVELQVYGGIYFSDVANDGEASFNVHYEWCS